MRVLVTGSAGHLGEGLVRTLLSRGYEVVGLDLLDSPFTTNVGSVSNREFVRDCMDLVDWVVHAAALHKPHLVTHSRASFVETNITGTLCMLEEALRSGVKAFVFSSTTSAFGAALRPEKGRPAVWVNEELKCIPRNIYGVTKKCAEDLCEFFFRADGLPCIILRTARFFCEADDNSELRQRYVDFNLKVNEYLYRRIDLADAVEAHLIAAQRAADLGFGRYVVCATSPFVPQDLALVRTNLPAVVRRILPDYEDVYRDRGWKMLQTIDRVYANVRARDDLGWTPHFDFNRAIHALRQNEEVFSPLSQIVGSKRYHARSFGEGPYPVDARE